MTDCRYKGWCRIEFDTDFDVCYPCVGDGVEACAEYEPMPDVKALKGLADEISRTSCDKFDGELTVDLIDIWGWAVAIREALGVES